MFSICYVFTLHNFRSLESFTAAVAQRKYKITLKLVAPLLESPQTHLLSLISIKISSLYSTMAILSSLLLYNEIHVEK